MRPSQRVQQDAHHGGALLQPPASDLIRVGSRRWFLQPCPERWPLGHVASPPAIYGEGFVKPICRFKSMEQKSARLSPSPSASVDLPHLSRRPAGVCAFCRISLEPEAEGDFPTASVGSSWGRRERDTLNHLFGIVRSYEHRQERTSPGKRYTKDATTQSNGDPRWGGRRGGRRGHPSKSSRHRQTGSTKP